MGVNPIYSPYFNISYRKRRKLELTADEVTILIRGSYDERRTLLSRYYKKWTVPSPDFPRRCSRQKRGKTMHT